MSALITIDVQSNLTFSNANLTRLPALGGMALIAWRGTLESGHRGPYPTGPGMARAVSRRLAWPALGWICFRTKLKQCSTEQSVNNADLEPLR
jgi:hypothetical protein